MRGSARPTMYQIRQAAAPAVIRPSRVRKRREAPTPADDTSDPPPNRCTAGRRSSRRVSSRAAAGPARQPSRGSLLWHAPSSSAPRPVEDGRRGARRRPGEAPTGPARGALGAVGHFGYQPALDGIRAFAVAAVLLYHAGQSWAVGGFLGVDTFFVLSGFLITTLLVTEWHGTAAASTCRAFWARRARRLLPRCSLVMVGIVVYAGAVRGAGRGRRASAATASPRSGYVANWRFIFSGQSYFDQFTQPSPLRHMWSLAIEEQFYLVWPLIVCVLLWWRRSLRALLVACAG